MSGVDKSLKVQDLIEKGWIEEPSDTSYLLKPPIGLFVSEELQNKVFHVYEAEELQALLFWEESLLD